MRRRATGLLGVAAIVFLVALFFEPSYPWVGFIRATAEASLVGGLADWFAVTAIFRRPLGLPIPHTAIVPTQKDRIGRTLGNFLQNHVLTREVVAAEVKALRLSERIARWMSDPEISRRIAKQMATGLAKAIEGLPEQEVRELIHRSAVARLHATRVAPILGNVLALVTSDDRHQRLLDEIIQIVGNALRQNRDAIRRKIREESPWWVPGLVDEAITTQIMTGVEELLREVRADRDHPVRRKFDQAVAEFIDQLRDSTEVSARAEAIKDQLLDHALVEDFIARLWDTVRNAAARRNADPDAPSPEALALGISSAGESLLAHEAHLREFDEFLTDNIAAVADRHRHQVSELITRTVGAWDPEVAARRLELAVGSDLQYIRINGTLVGGLAGLVIHTLSLVIGR
jgi:uncharacterized membrane-anchored protein YjiN (DUF445 family)